MSDKNYLGYRGGEPRATDMASFHQWIGIVDGVVRGLTTLVEIENRSRQRNQARQNRSRKNHNVSISSDSAYNSVDYDPVKTRLLESEAEVEEQTNRKARNRILHVTGLFFCFCMRLRKCSFR